MDVEYLLRMILIIEENVFSFIKGSQHTLFISDIN